MGGPSVGAGRVAWRRLHSSLPLFPFLVASLLLAPGPAAGAETRSAQGGDDRTAYIVVLKEGAGRAATVAQEHSRRFGARVSHVFESALPAYAAELPAQAVQGISRDGRVALVEEDQPVFASGQTVPTGVRRVFAPMNPAVAMNGADDVRIDADIAILDTGIDLDHPDLNVASSADCTAASSASSCISGLGEDDNGHGTHVAGTAAAVDNGFGVVGVAPGARLHAVKVLSATGVGMLSSVIAGIDWVTARADVIEVANMSLGCRCPSLALDLALATSVDRGVVYTTAAGNNSEDARNYFPAAHPDVIAVSAIADHDGEPGARTARGCRVERDDTLAVFSNWGPAVDLAAPGFCILSTAMLGSYDTMSGTSMAAPHAAGAAALLAQGGGDPQDGAAVAGIKEQLVRAGNLGWLDESPDGIHEPLLDASAL